MKADHPKVSMDKICGMFGLTRQAYYWTNNNTQQKEFNEEVVLMLVQEIRHKMPKIGGKKLYNMIYPDLKRENIKMGRDKFFDLLRTNGLLNKRKRVKVKTTFSGHGFRKYKNLIKDFEANSPNQLWVSDLTYIRLESGFAYLSLVTDVYSRKILGWHLDKTLKAEGTIKALKLALKNLGSGETSPRPIHHSDRGVQYYSYEYVELLEKRKVKISMTENGDPRENPIAERVNGILKEEFSLYGFRDFKEAEIQIKQSIHLYNSLRPHLSLDYLTPDHAYGLTGKLQRRWKSYYPKSSNSGGNTYVPVNC